MNDYPCDCRVCQVRRLCQDVVDGNRDAYLTILDIKARLGDA